MVGSEQVEWIIEGEKYAVVGLSVKVKQNVPNGLIAPRLWVVNGPQFQMPIHWKEWLGTIRAEEVEAANLFLLSKIKSERPDVLDGENQTLQRLVSLFYVGLFAFEHFFDRTQAGCFDRFKAQWRSRHSSTR